MSVVDSLSKLKRYSEELGLDLTRKEDRFKWFIASLLFAKRISADIAKRTFRELVRRGLTSPHEILEAGWDALVEALDSGGYVRYDFSTATNILETVKKLINEYEGDVDKIHEGARSSKDLEKRIMEFKGFGPVAANIFLRELRGIWEKADPKPSKLALKVANKLRISNVKEFESELVRVYLEYCKRRKCDVCPVREHCAEPLR